MLTEEDEWPLKDGYWLQLNTGRNMFLSGKDIMAVLSRAEKALGKSPHSGEVTGLVEFGLDGSDPFNEAVFVIMPVFQKCNDMTKCGQCCGRFDRVVSRKAAECYHLFLAQRSSG
jgi:hypothetical protein